MQTKFRLINDDGGWGLGLQQRGCQANESYRAVGELPRLEGERTPFLTPFQSHQLTLAFHLGFKHEVVEERRYQLDRLPYPLVSCSVLFPHLQQERSNIPCIRT